jgi:hypothetical protein
MMSNAKYTVGIDYGTESGRVVIIDVADGREVASHSPRRPLCQPAPMAPPFAFCRSGAGILTPGQNSGNITPPNLKPPK